MQYNNENSNCEMMAYYPIGTCIEQTGYLTTSK